MKCANSWELEDIQLKWNGEVNFLKKWDTSSVRMADARQSNKTQGSNQAGSMWVY